MEDASKEQTASNVNAGKSKLRYPLRSASKAKEEKTSSTIENPNSSAPKRGRTPSSVSKSMNVLDLSGKDRSGKPPRRLSIPTKPAGSPLPKATGTITPISEVRARRSYNAQEKSDTPASDISRSGNRRKFSVISSASYWLSQIKLSETAAKHSISVGLFRLAQEAGCEPFQRMRDELKAYARRHNLVNLGEDLKELFDRYNISENFEQLQVSETCSQVPEESTRSSDEDVNSSSMAETRKFKPKSLNNDAAQYSCGTRSVNKESAQKSNSTTRIRGSSNQNSLNLRSISESGSRNLPKKPQQLTKKEFGDKAKIKKQAKEVAGKEVNPSSTVETVEENKENADGSPDEGARLDGAEVA